MKGVNDSPAHAEELADLVRGRCSVLIPYNPTSVGVAYEAPSRRAVLAFQAVLRAKGILTTIRQEMGGDVDGACGQLALRGRDRRGAAADEPDVNNVYIHK